MPDIDSPRRILEQLVAFPSVSRDSNLDLIDWIENWLAQYGISATRVYNDDRSKASIYAHTGPMQPGAVVLSGHTDVVPVDGQNWTTDPFTVTERDGKLFGRGTTDMKGFDALALWAMARAATHGVTRPLQIALSRDEEIGCLGAPAMIDDMIASGLPRGDTVIVGEPSMMSCVTGHKGGTGYWIKAKGFEVHSSLMHKGVSAIMEAARVIAWAHAQNKLNADAPPGEMAALFDPPYTTLHTGIISGGTAHNITAADCTFGVDFRVVPGDSIDKWSAKLFHEINRIETEMKAIHPDAGLPFEKRFDVPALTPELNGAAEHLVRRLTGDNGTHVVSYGTEAGQFQERGYSAVICGPGDIAQAHQPDEYITVDQFNEGQRLMDRLLAMLQE